MKGRKLIADPPEFPTFQLAHRVEGGNHHFEVAYGSSFNELYEFTPGEFFGSPNQEELALQLRRAGAKWFLGVLADIAEGKRAYTTEQLLSLATRGARVMANNVINTDGKHARAFGASMFSAGYGER